MKIMLTLIIALSLPLVARADWTLLQQNTITTSAEYQQRVEMAFLKVALDVINEAPETANHAERVTLANAVFKGSGVPPRAAKVLHLLNPALQGTLEPTDNDILFTVSQQWNYFADD